MKKIELAFTSLLVPLDFVVVFCAAISAYGLRYNWLSWLRPFVITIPFDDYVVLAAGWAAVFIACYSLAGLYTIRSARKLKSELSKIFLASSAAAMASIVMIFFRGELFASRFIVLAAWLFAMLAVAFTHILVRLLQRGLLHVGIGSRRVVIIGGKDHSSILLNEEFEGNPGFGYRIVDTIPSFSATSRSRLDAHRGKNSIDEIIVTNPKISRDELADILSFAESRQLTFSYAADLVATYGRNIDLGVIAGVPLVTIKSTRLEGWGRVYKRLFDIFGALFLIIVTSPVMLLAAIAVKLSSRGPIIFRNERVGQDEKHFEVLKFRSMRAEYSVGKQFANQSDALAYEAQLIRKQSIKGGPVYKIKDDPRITGVGAFIRRYSIDELPQFFNVLTGSMSLVGPRPHQPREVAKYEDHHRRVFTVRPGITGMAQISGRSDLTFEDEVRLDTYYIENWSLWMDIAILLKTPFVVFRKKGAY